MSRFLIYEDQLNQHTVKLKVTILNYHKAHKELIITDTKYDKTFFQLLVLINHTARKGEGERMKKERKSRDE